MADAPPGYQSSSMIPAAGGIIHAIRGGGIPPPGYNPDSLISLTHTTPPIVGFEGGGGETAAEIAAAAAAVSTSTAAATVTPVADSAEPFDDDLAKKIAVAAVVSSPAATDAVTDATADATAAATATDATTAATATDAADAPATKEINLNGRRLTIGAPGTWDATMNVPSTPEYEALKWFGVHKTKRNDLKKEILQALYDGICDTNKPLIMALECEPLRRIIQSLAEIQMGNLMAPMRMMSAKAASTDMSEAILMTYNVYQHLCQANKAADYINRSNVDIICTQEDTDGSKLNNYTEVKSCGGGSETERVYMKNNIATNDECISVPGIEIDSVRTPTRSAVLFTVQGVKIANVHLEGGQVTDKKIFTNTAALQAKKLELLEKVLEKQPHIIVGDFNSVYHSIPNVKERFLNIQYDYFSKTVLKKVLTDAEKTIINNWNNAPYDLLLKGGYTYATPSNEDQITNGNTIVDTIWYKEDKDLFELKDTKIDTIMKTGDTYDTPAGCEYSDHNPVLTTIVFKNTAAEADKAAVVAADAASDGAANKMAEGLASLATGATRPPYPSAKPPGVLVATPPTASLSDASATPVEATTVAATTVEATAAQLAGAPSPPGSAATIAALPSPPGNTAAIAAFSPGSAAAVQKKSENELLAQATLNMAAYTSVDETKENELAKQIAVAAVATILGYEANNDPAATASTTTSSSTASAAAPPAPVASTTASAAPITSNIKKVTVLPPIKGKETSSANRKFVNKTLQSQANAIAKQRQESNEGWRRENEYMRRKKEMEKNLRGFRARRQGLEKIVFQSPNVLNQIGNNVNLTERLGEAASELQKTSKDETNMEESLRQLYESSIAKPKPPNDQSASRPSVPFSPNLPPATITSTRVVPPSPTPVPLAPISPSKSPAPPLPPPAPPLPPLPPPPPASLIKDIQEKKLNDIKNAITQKVNIDTEKKQNLSKNFKARNAMTSQFKQIRGLKNYARNAGVSQNSAPESASKPASASKSVTSNALDKLAAEGYDKKVNAQLSEQKQIELSAGTEKNLINYYISQINHKIRSLKQGELSESLEKKRDDLKTYFVKLDTIVASNQAFNEKEEQISKIGEDAKKHMKELEGGKRRSKKRRTQKKKRHNKRSTQRK